MTIQYVVSLHRIENSGFAAIPCTRNNIILVALGYDLAPKGDDNNYFILTDNGLLLKQ